MSFQITNTTNFLLRQPMTVALIGETTERNRRCLPANCEAADQLDAEIDAHNATVRKWLEYETSVRAGKIDPDDAVDLVRELGIGHVKLRAAKCKFVERAERIRVALTADCESYRVRRSNELAKLTEDAAAVAKTFFPGDSSSVQAALMQNRELGTLRFEVNNRPMFTMRSKIQVDTDILIARLALGAEVIAAAGLSEVVQYEPVLIVED